MTYDGSSRAAGLQLYLNGANYSTTECFATTCTRSAIACRPSATASHARPAIPRPRFQRRRDRRVARLRPRADAAGNRRPLTTANRLRRREPIRNSRREASSPRYLLLRHRRPKLAQRPQQLRDARQQVRRSRRADARSLGDGRVARAAADATSSPAAPTMRRRPTPTASTATRSPRCSCRFPTDAPRNRLGLARWLTDPHHPLTARVFVNRLWANFFGRGLVATPENFGRQGARADASRTARLARPRLRRPRLGRQTPLPQDRAVGHLSARLALRRRAARARSGKSAARPRPEPPPLRRADPRPRPRRLGPARSQAWAARPCRPTSPAAICGAKRTRCRPPISNRPARRLYRRSLYSVWKRTAPLPNMMAFDATIREVCTVARGRTNTPLQALVLLNDVQFVEAARAWPPTLPQSAHTTCATQIDEAFLRLTGRHPDATELNLLADLYNEQRTLFADTVATRPRQVLDARRIEARPETRRRRPRRAHRRLPGDPEPRRHDLRTISDQSRSTTDHRMQRPVYNPSDEPATRHAPPFLRRLGRRHRRRRARLAAWPMLSRRKPRRNR